MATQHKTQAKPPSLRPARFPIFIGLMEAAEMLSVDDETIRRYVADGTLRHGVIKGRKRILTSSVYDLADRALKGKA